MFLFFKYCNWIIEYILFIFVDIFLFFYFKGFWVRKIKFLLGNKIIFYWYGYNWWKIRDFNKYYLVIF